MRVVTHRYNDNEYIHVSYFDSLDGSIKYRFNRRGTTGALLGNGSLTHAAADNVARGWTNLDGGFDADDWVRLASTPTGTAAVAPFSFVEAGGRIVNHDNRTGDPNAANHWPRIWAGEHNDIAVTGDGFPLVVYFDSTNERLRMAISNSRTPYRGNAWTIVEHVIPVADARAFGTGQYVSLRIDTQYGGAGDRVHIAAWNSEVNGVVYVTGTITFAGTVPTWNFTHARIVDDVGNVGRRTRISLDEDGNPWIAYLDQRNVGNMDGLKVAFFNPDFAASGTWDNLYSRDVFGGDISGWESMHVPAQYRVLDERDFMIRSQLGMENFPTRNFTGTRTDTRIWRAAVAFSSVDLYRIAYWVE